MPSKPGLTSIRFRAAILTSALAAIAVVAVIAYSFVTMRAILLRGAEARAGAAAAQIAGMVGAPLPGRLAEIQQMVDDPAIRGALEDTSDDAVKAAMERLKPLTTNAQVQQTFELWNAAQVRTMAVRLPATATVPFANGPPDGIGIRPYAIENGVPISQTVAPVHAAGDTARVVGYLVNRRLASSAGNNEILNRLIGSGGRVLVGNQSGTVWIDLSAQVARLAVDTTTPGTRRYQTPDGEARLAGVAHVASTPLAIVVDFPQALMIAPAWTLLRQLALVGLAFVALALIVAWSLSARVTQPLDQLANALDAVSAGDYSQRVGSGRHSETGRLGAAFNAMAARIEGALAELEAQAAAIRENDRRKSAMMNAALDCIITTDASGRITECNPAAERTFGLPEAELARRDLHTLLALPDFEGNLDRRIEVQGRRRDGSAFPADVSLVAIRSAGAPGYAAFVRDLTDQKAGEESLLRGIVLEEENRRVVEASRLKSEFLANMSHELRTPLNAIIGFAELLYDGQVTPDMPQFREFMGDILTSGQHLLQLINDVLDLSKVEAGRLEFHPEETNPAAIVTESIAMLRTLAAQKQLTVNQEVDASIGIVLLDRARLKQVLYNYLSNAIKFTPAGGRIDVTVTPSGDDRFRVAVRDTGIGISAADVQRLFIEFNQLEAGAAKKHQGTGLGLALTRRLIEAQGGAVGVDSVPGQGSTFYAVLPRRASTGTPLISPRSIAAHRIGAPSVLVVEDDATDQDAIVRVLSDAGFNVETAATRAQALIKLASQAFDAITLDLILPDANGVDILRDLRASDRNRDVPVVVITIVANKGAVAGFAVNDILAKPVDGNGLIAALARAGVKPASDGSILVVDDDPGSLRLMAATLGQLGYETITTTRAIDGLRACERRAPLAVVLDLQMPEMDGFAFLDHFRQLPSCRTTPVIVWTVKDLTHQDYERLRATVQGIVGKGRTSSTSVVDELRRFVTQRQA